ncbi:hypothetical protein G6F68_005328 [Rhizopus microsporus]|nr:hypothetical protein G6F69_006405 [Rhizopus microsporus]KAG1230903.1 hypothetical protein G6F67_006137 [Rhizopus microsporus]KAG1263201.1 hypothetical protein G6F68_005328 [Rhizopus microsporus]
MAISFLYREGPAERLKRLKLPAVRKESNSSRLDSLCRQSYCCQAALIKSRFVLKQQITTSHFLMETVGKDSPFVQFPGPDNVVNSNGENWKKERFRFWVLKGDAEKWRAEYKLVMGTLFDPVTNVFTGLDFLLRYVCPKRIRGAKAVNNLNKLFDQLVKEKRLEVQNGVHVNKPQDEKDLLTLMLEAKQRGEAMTTDMETGHNVVVFFLAGIVCQVQQKLREEVDRVMGRESVDAAPTLEELSQMEYFLRLCSIFDVLVLRHTVEDMYLDDTFIPKDTRITVDVSAIQRDSKVWNRPDDFIPERFMEGGEAIGHEGMAWLPFGGGARQCIGMNFSLTEQKVALAMLDMILTFSRIRFIMRILYMNGRFILYHSHWN